MAYEVKVAVYNSAGEVVKEITVERTSSPVAGVTAETSTLISRVGDVIYLYNQGNLIGTWDGTNQSGKMVANGEYYVKVDSVDSYGVDQSVFLTVTVDRKVARLDITVYNAAGEAVRHLMNVEAADLGGNVQSVALSSDVIEPNSSTTGVAVALTVSLPNGTNAVWDGRSDTGAYVADGQYYVEVREEGAGSTTAVVVKTVAVLGSDGGMRVAARPNVLSTSNTATTFVGPSGTTLRVSVYTSTGEKVAQIWGAPGTGTAVWDSTGSAAGLYLAVATTYDPSGRMHDRMTLKLIVK